MSPAGGSPGSDACNKPYNAAVCNTGNEMETRVSQVSGWIRRLPTVHVFLFVLGELRKEAAPFLTHGAATTQQREELRTALTLNFCEPL